MLGIIIGVASVIAMLAIGEGSNRNIKASVASLGTNSIMIFPGSNNQGGARQGASTNQTLKAEDVEAIRLRCELVNLVSPIDQKRAQVIYGAENWNTSVLGVTSDYLTIRSFVQVWCPLLNLYPFPVRWSSHHLLSQSSAKVILLLKAHRYIP